MRSSTAWGIVWFGGLGLAILFVIGGIVAGSLREVYFLSDNLYIPALFADLVHWHGRLSDWKLTPAPYFFPDMLIYSVATLLAPRLDWSQYLGGCLQLLAIVVAARTLLRRAMPRRRAASSVIAPLFVIWLMLYYFGGAALVGPVLVLSSHGGAVLAAFVTYALCLRPVKSPRNMGTIGAIAVSALAGLSDPLFVVSCSAVLAFSCALQFRIPWTRRVDVRPMLLGRALLAAASGFAGAFVARAAGLAHAEIASGSLDLAFETAAALWREIDPVPWWALGGLLLVAGLGALFCIVARGRASDCGLRMLAGWQLACATLVMLAMLWYGRYADRWTLRYMAVSFNLNVVFLCALIARYLPESTNVDKPERSSIWVASCIVLAGAFALGIQVSAFSGGGYVTPQYAASLCVRDLAQREGVDTLISDYWHAKPLMLLSEGGAHVVQVRNSLQPYWWINSRAWYRDRKRFGIVVTNGLNSSRIVKSLGHPQSIERCKDLELYIYRGTAAAAMTWKLQQIFGRFIAASALPVPR